MCGPYVQLAMAAYQAYSQVQQGKYAAGVDKYNARVAENQAVETRNKGVEDENIQRQRAAQLLSKQRAQLGASGVELGSGSALQLQQDTLTLGEADALRIRSNVSGQVGALQTQSELLKSQGKMKLAAGVNKGAGTLMSGVSSFSNTGVADKWFTPNSAARS